MNARDLWIGWMTLAVLTLGALVLSVRYATTASIVPPETWLIVLRHYFYVPLAWLALAISLGALAGLILRRWPRILLALMALTTVAQMAVFAIEAHAHHRVAKPIIERWLG